MKIKKENKKTLINEIEFAIQKMKEEQNPKAKIYYFSAVYGVMQRIFNIDYDSDLVFAHFVISSTFNNVNMRLLNPDPVIKIPDDLTENIISVTEELLEMIKKDMNLYEVLKKFVLIGYITVGNGYYLYQKGLIKI